MPDTILEIADYGSQQSDRWLFIALLVVAGVAFVWLTKWFIAQIEKAHQSTAEINLRFADYLQKNGAESVMVIAKCSQVMDQVLEELREMRALRAGRRFDDYPHVAKAEPPGGGP